MHRSASTQRFAADFYRPSMGQSSVSAMEMEYKLPTYDPQSDAGKKEAARARLSENMVHLIPLVLLLCAMVLWFFSHPVSLFSPGAEMDSDRDSIAARIKNMTIDGYSNQKDVSMTTMGQEELVSIDTGRDLDSKDY